MAFLSVECLRLKNRDFVRTVIGHTFAFRRPFHCAKAKHFCSIYFFLEFSPGRLKNNFAHGHILIGSYNNPILYPVYFTTYFSIIQHNITYLYSYVTFIVFNLAYGFNR